MRKISLSKRLSATRQFRRLLTIAALQEKNEQVLFVMMQLSTSAFVANGWSHMFCSKTQRSNGVCAPESEIPRLPAKRQSVTGRATATPSPTYTTAPRKSSVPPFSMNVQRSIARPSHPCLTYTAAPDPALTVLFEKTQSQKVGEPANVKNAPPPAY